MKDKTIVNQIFDRRQVRYLRENSVFLSPPYDFLHRDLESKIGARVAELTQAFKKILIIGSKTPFFEKNIIADLVFYDFGSRGQDQAVIGDEEFLPFKESSFDLVISVGHLHQVNQLKECVGQCQKVLKPGGMILGAVIGEMSLVDVRQHIIAEEIKLNIGNASRLSPMLELTSVAKLLNACGFTDPVCDVNSYSLEYSKLRLFVDDLRAMGESNILINRSKNLSSRFFKAIFEHKVPVELDYIFFAALKPLLHR